LITQAINLYFVALRLCQNSGAPLESQWVAGRHGSFTVEDGLYTAISYIVFRGKIRPTTDHY
jgi:hypothetical protein